MFNFPVLILKKKTREIDNSQAISKCINCSTSSPGVTNIHLTYDSHLRMEAVWHLAGPRNRQEAILLLTICCHLLSGRPVTNPTSLHGQITLPYAIQNIKIMFWLKLLTYKLNIGTNLQNLIFFITRGLPVLGNTHTKLKKNKSAARITVLCNKQMPVGILGSNEKVCKGQCYNFLLHTPHEPL